MIRLVDGCGIVSTISQAELHKFAAKLGLDRKSHSKPHGPRASGFYLLKTKKLQRKALSLGAVEYNSQTGPNLSRNQARQLRHLDLLAPRKT